MCYVRNATNEHRTATERGQSAMRAMTAASTRRGASLSIQAYSWAIEHQETVTDPSCQLVLMCLAYYAGVDGCNAFPSVARIARNSRLSERSVQRALKKLLELGIIEHGSRIVPAAHIARTDKRPQNYNIVLRGDTQTPRKGNGVTHSRSGVTSTTERGDTVTPDPISDPSINRKSVFENVEAEIAQRFGPKPTSALVNALAQQKRLRK